jgi:Leucine-rich repeat (LRR) protein
MITRLFSISLILLCLYGPLPIVSTICRDFSCSCSENSGFTYVDCNLETNVNSSQYDDVIINDDESEDIEILTIQKALNGILPNDLLNGGYKIRLMVAVGLNLKALSPNVFDGVQSVRTLYLSANRLSTVNFDQFPLNFTENLESLVLNNNSFTEIPSFNGRLFKSLSYLDLSSNKISDSKQIANLQSLETLEELNLGSNFLRSINFSVFSPSLRLSLKRLKLDANKIEYITDLEGFHSLTLLSLYKNKILQLGPTFFKGLPNIVALDLSWNRIIDLPRGIFGGLFKLEWLSLANNKLSMLKGDEFEDLKSINLLELQNNRLEIFHLKWLEYAVELITLDLSKNLIETLKFGTVLSNLRVLRLSDNKIEV